ncbi:MAG TPA: multiheme c-type cytochrome [Rhodanobacteraceae bacterium]|nr:multiheme c-type cytochrome [Rhodanobacteraceae bacterium]
MSRNKRHRNQPDNVRSPGPASPAASRREPPRRRFRWLVPGIAALGFVAIAWDAWIGSKPPPQAVSATAPAAAKPDANATFVGAKACAECHAGEAAKWEGSQHAHAMQHATEATVLGNFNGAKFNYNGIVSTFYRRDGKFFVNTDGADGKLADFEVSYTFGLYPLQQYLVAFPDGRMQALSIAWDSRPKAQGGARWYHLYPDEHITSTDQLHWTGLNQNWNWMCADCHSTKLDRNYAASNNSYATKWSETNVACEACHGPGSKHVSWAKHEPGADKFVDRGLIVALDERKGITWLLNAQTGNSARSAPLTSHRELGVCAQCHSRRAPFAAGMDHDGRFFETHEVSLLTSRLYFADGQQREEVYDIGSFLQSKMHANGVTCSDCHDPHSGALRAPGNAVCAQCHAPARYDAAAHSLHAAGSAGAQCAACHMPTRNYMVIDARHDHSIRIPRPDLSDKLGTPNACTACHKDRKPAWAATVIERAFGPQRKGFQTFGAALHDADTGAPGAVAGLMALARSVQQPAIVRASAALELGHHLNEAALPAIEAALADADPGVRAAALDALLAAPPAERMRLAVGLIDDPSRIVRIKAARAFAVARYDGMAPEMQARFDKVFAEYVASQRANADRPEAHMNLGMFYVDRRDPVRSEAEYRAALALQPAFIPAVVNLADLYRAYERDADAEAVLTEGLRKAPGNADVSHALGLLRVREGRVSDALPLLADAARANPGNARYAYVYGIALHDSGQEKKGIAVLEQALKRFPGNAELLSVLAGYARDSGDAVRSDAYTRRLEALAPQAAARAE